MKEQPIIAVENLTKIFKFPHERYTTIKQHFVNILRRRTTHSLKALDDVSFEVKKGEFLGIIGPNGSGKSTLLKILAQIYQPTAGKIEINGTLSPFIELGVGFNPELTARDNVFLNAAILGLSKKETEDRFDEIIKFSELEEFVDQKLKNFSSGMQVRLAFSIAVQAKADILLIDEVLAVGDASFQEKCFKVFRKLKKEGKTIIFVSHALNTIEEFSDRCLLVYRGKIRFDGKPNEAILEYTKINSEVERDQVKSANEKKGQSARILRVHCLNSKGGEESIFRLGDELTAAIEFEKNSKNPELNFGVSIYREDGVYCYGINTFIDKFNTKGVSNRIWLSFNNLHLLGGAYYLVAAIFGKSESEVIDYNPRAAVFKLIAGIKDQGIVKLEHKWGLKLNE